MSERVVLERQVLESRDKGEFARSRTLEDVDARGMSLVGLRLDETTWRRVCFDDADLDDFRARGCDFSESSWLGAALTGAMMMDTILDKGRFDAVLWRDGLLTASSLRECSLREVDLSGSTLIGASFARADLTGATLKRVNARSASFAGARLEGADLSASDLREADFRGAHLTDARFVGANVEGAVFDPGFVPVTTPSR
jgi:uncharacterized protein YjbI with pentapeptide repeats